MVKIVLVLLFSHKELLENVTPNHKFPQYLFIVMPAGIRNSPEGIQQIPEGDLFS